MSKFFVGQRVRVVGVYASCFHHVIGMEGVINAVGCKSYLIDDAFGVTLPIPDKVHGRQDCWAFASYQLEPILDQKHEACDEDFKRDLDRLLERQGVVA